MRAAGLANGFTAKELAVAMNELFKEGRVQANMDLPWREASRHNAVGIARCGPV